MTNLSYLQRVAGGSLLCLLLGACATAVPTAALDAKPPPQWHSPLPHDGDPVKLSQWWRAQGDAALVQFIDAAQAVSPTIASARSRIEQARAARVAAGAALAPNLNGTASLARSSAQPPLPAGTTTQIALQSSWELDLFGANRALRDAAQARLEGAAAGWHDARTAVAAEVANQYYSARSCATLLDVAEADAASRAETFRLAQLSERAGFQAPANVALAGASAAESRARATQQDAACKTDVKALVALTGIAEPEVVSRLAQARREEAGAGALTALAARPEPVMAVASVPARLLAQRPDVFAAEREVAAASADLGSAQAQRFPRLSLSGSVGVANFRTGGEDTRLNTWSIGPVALTVPIFDGGRLAANQAAAEARYGEAVAAYHGKVRQAVREVEEALVSLQGAEARREDLRRAAEGYRASFAATESRYKNGLASLVELEDSRRIRLAAENALAGLERERRAAQVALYRALGGGWTADAAEPPRPEETPHLPGRS
ncbi:efflux transporter outer membrane subunit [Noviherbaspirillum galbum]|uniref:Efflux transporter outer membrane subunit n=1 Tax=Noviherbaspirillum galbum TaxID=2709383 RepID=A0A6B3SLK3_9BURK|nr:efflux transporter outer membrane subunit [Noviherbaspirillum galbum]NEX59516.1 efflux transporter outer membrane subunit [Noviherbaspirillum galbum]